LGKFRAPLTLAYNLTRVIGVKPLIAAIQT
jgi:hypothetical protein